jgi:hypothetical protein
MLLEGSSMAQQAKSKIVGTWIITSTDDYFEDGHKVNQWGPNVIGTAIYDEKGHYSLIILGADLPVQSATPIVSSKKVIAHFGTYVFDEASKTVTYKVEHSTFPPFEGATRKANVELLSDTDMTIIGAQISSPEGKYAPHQVYKRAN